LQHKHQNIQFVSEFKNQDAERASEKAINKTFELEILLQNRQLHCRKKDLCIRVLVGENKKNHQGLWQNVRTLGKNNVNIRAYCSRCSERNILLLMKKMLKKH
jgi:aspartokinase